MTLLHRDEERVQIDKALHECVTGTAGLLLVEGAVGCGKTELLQYVAERASWAGCTVLRAAARAEGRRTKNALLRQLAALPLPGRTEPRTRPACPQDPDDAWRQMADALRDACGRRPLALCVDDLQYADDASLAGLVDLTLALRGTGLLIVLAQSPHDRADSQVIATELLRHPGFARIRLDRLGQADTAELARYWGTPVPMSLAGQLHRISGGNPLLLRALLTEHPTGAQQTAWPEPTPGGPFTEAFRTCLSRCDYASHRLALAFAVLGEHSTVPDAAQLAGLTRSVAARAAAALDAAGLTDGPRLSHPVAEAAVRDALDTARRSALHREAARLLHLAQVEPAAVADQLLQAGTVSHSWEVQILCEAAGQDPAPVEPVGEGPAGEERVGEGAQERATALLRLARSGCCDPQTRYRIALQLAAHTWRTDPAEAHRHLTEPLAALRSGQLSPSDTGQLARLLAAQGRLAESDEALAACRATRPTSGAADEPLRELFALPPNRGERPLQVRASTLWTYPHSADVEQSAERLLLHTPLAPATFEPVAQALRILVHTDRTRRAIGWCQTLGEEAAARRAPGWQAVFATMHADALLRLGDLDGARREASFAVDRLAGRGGMYLLAPTAILIQALTTMGEYVAAARHLEPGVHGELLSTVHCLTFQRARGRYHLATQRPDAALGAFLDAGRLAFDWGIDRPDLLPWRSDAAEALLRLDQRDEAARLLAEQLAMAGAAEARVQGVSLRLSAATEEPARRPELLFRAVNALRDCGDRLELARALADLGAALRVRGEGTRAGSFTRRAWQLASECGAVPLCEQIGPTKPSDGRSPSVQALAHGKDNDLLSESEMRVAVLAAHGYTNREISARLFVSLSTVEQYLTRAYRKLNISRRQDLPVDLQLEAADLVPR